MRASGACPTAAPQTGDLRRRHPPVEHHDFVVVGAQVSPRPPAGRGHGVEPCSRSRAARGSASGKATVVLGRRFAVGELPQRGSRRHSGRGGSRKAAATGAGWTAPQIRPPGAVPPHPRRSRARRRPRPAWWRAAGGARRRPGRCARSPGRTSSTRLPPCSESASPRPKAIQAGLGRPVHEVGLAGPDCGDRGQHHDGAVALSAHPGGGGEQRGDVAGEVGLDQQPGAERVTVQDLLPGQDARRGDDQVPFTPAKACVEIEGLMAVQRGGVETPTRPDARRAPLCLPPPSLFVQASSASVSADSPSAARISRPISLRTPSSSTLAGLSAAPRLSACTCR